MRKNILITCLAFVLILSACGKSKTNDAAGPENIQGNTVEIPSGDIKEMDKDEEEPVTGEEQEEEKYDSEMFLDGGDFMGIPFTANGHDYLYPMHITTLLKDWKYDVAPGDYERHIENIYHGGIGTGTILITPEAEATGTDSDNKGAMLVAGLISPTLEDCALLKDGYVVTIDIRNDKNSELLGFSCGDRIEDVVQKYGDTLLYFSSGTGTFDEFEIEYTDMDDDGKIDVMSIRYSTIWTHAPQDMYENGWFDMNSGDMVE